MTQLNVNELKIALFGEEANIIKVAEGFKGTTHGSNVIMNMPGLLVALSDNDNEGRAKVIAKFNDSTNREVVELLGKYLIKNTEKSGKLIIRNQVLITLSTFNGDAVENILFSIVNSNNESREVRVKALKALRAKNDVKYKKVLKKLLRKLDSRESYDISKVFIEFIKDNDHYIIDRLITKFKKKNASSNLVDIFEKVKDNPKVHYSGLVCQHTF